MLVPHPVNSYQATGTGTREPLKSAFANITSCLLRYGATFIQLSGFRGQGGLETVHPGFPPSLQLQGAIQCRERAERTRSPPRGIRMEFLAGDECSQYPSGVLAGPPRVHVHPPKGQVHPPWRHVHPPRGLNPPRGHVRSPIPRRSRHRSASRRSLEVVRESLAHPGKNGPQYTYTYIYIYIYIYNCYIYIYDIYIYICFIY